MGSYLGNISEVVAKYSNLKHNVMPNVANSVLAQTKKEMQSLRDGLWTTIADFSGKIVFNSPQELAGALNMLLDTGKIFGLDWVRKTTSKSDPTKVAGSIDSLRVKKVDGYVKGTSEGKKQLEDVLAGRITLWVANGKLYSNGYGNWRSPYVKDIRAIKLSGQKVLVEVKQ